MRWVRFFVGVVSLAIILSYLHAFFVAYLNPSKTVVVDINVVGEAHVEFVIMVCYVVCLAYEGVVALIELRGGSGG